MSRPPGSAPLAGVRRLPGVAALARAYDALLVDQFGTLHDGVRPYPGAADALRRLRDAGTGVVLLSNSGKRAARNAERLARMGIGPGLYDRFVTSGEAGWRMLAEGRVPGAPGVRRCLLLSRDGDRSVLDGTPVQTAGPAEAELVVIAGSEGERRPLSDYEALLGPLAARGVPALCLNPDRTMLTPDGPAFGAGRIAEAYAALGGAVTWVGKPHPAIYAEALAALGGPAPGRVAGVGDSVEHDVAGARGAGCPAVLLRAGILAGADDAAVEAECAARGVWPDALAEGFVWA